VGVAIGGVGGALGVACLGFELRRVGLGVNAFGCSLPLLTFQRLALGSALLTHRSLTACRLLLRLALRRSLFPLDLLLAGVGLDLCPQPLLFGFDFLLAVDDLGLALLLFCGCLELRGFRCRFGLGEVELAFALELLVANERSGDMLDGAFDAISDSESRVSGAHEGSFAVGVQGVIP
jgi:hypothetical protein